MVRLLQTLLVILMVSAAFAGCFGDDGSTHDHDGHDHDDDPPAGNVTNNNTTDDPFANVRLPPIPVIKLSLEADGGEVEGPPFLVDFQSNVTMTFDASQSSDPDGEVQAVSWDISSASGFSGTSSNETFVAEFGEMKSTMYGAYKVVLKVLDDDNILNTTTAYFVINYRNTFELPGGMTGPGTADRNGQDQKVSTLPQINQPYGTFELHQLTLAKNATSINLTLNYEAGPQTEMALYLFDPSVATTEDTNSAEPAAEAGPAASPIELSHTGDLQSGAWKVRAEMDGVQIESYTIDVIVTYKTPTIPEADLSDDDEDAAEDETGDEGDEGDEGEDS